MAAPLKPTTPSTSSSPNPLIPPPLPHENPIELNKMCRGENYLANDPYLSRLRDLAVIRNDACNLELDSVKRMEIYKEWLGVGRENSWIMRDFTCEYVCMYFDVKVKGR